MEGEVCASVGWGEVRGMVLAVVSRTLEGSPPLI